MSHSDNKTEVSITHPMLQICKCRFLATFICMYISFGGVSLANQIPTVAPAFYPVTVPDLPLLTSVHVIYQDSIGMIWIGTESGLVSYDANSSVLYDTNNIIEGGISSNHVTAIAEDRNGFIWVATVNGLNRLDRKSQKFSQYLIRPQAEGEYVNNRVYDVFVDSKDRIWAASPSALYLYNENTDAFTSFRPWHPEYSYNNLDIWAHVVQEDAKGNIWLGTSAGGIIKFDPKAYTFKHFSSHLDNTNQFPNDFINTIQVKATNELLVGTEIGLIWFDTASFETTRILPDIINAPVNDLFIDDSGYWWMIAGSEIFQLSPDLKNVEKRGIIDSQKFSTVQQSATSLFLDRENNIWTAFEDIGLHIISKHSDRVKTVKFSQYEKINNYTKINDVISSDNGIWIATKQELSLIQSNGESISVLNNIERSNEDELEDSLNLGGFYALHKTSTNDLLVGRAQGYSKITNLTDVTHYPFFSKDPSSYIVEDAQKNIWMIAGEKGIVINLDIESEHPFYDLQDKVLQGDFSTAKHLFVSSNREHIFMQYEGYGLFKFNIKSNELTQITRVNPDKHYINIQKTDSDTLILYDGSKQALELDLANGQVTDHELPANGISCMLRTVDDEAWFTQLKGSIYRSYGDDFVAMRPREGVPFLGMTGRQCLSIEKALLLPSYEGLLIIDSTKDLTNNATSNTIITNIRDAGNRETAVRFHEKPNAIANQYTANIEIAYGETPLIFTYSLLSFSDSKNNRFKYKVSGLDEVWTETKSTSATLSHLPSGTFAFQVIGSNPDGTWSNAAAVTKIEVFPPYWLSWWAKLLYFLVVLVVLTLIYYYRTRAIRNRAKYFEEMVEIRTQELAKEKEIVEQLLDKKNNEFANVSHEFRTPITLILGPIQSLLQSNIRSSTRKKLEIAKRNGHRLLRMVDQLLNMEKFKVQKIINSHEVEVKPIASLLLESFKDLAAEKQIKLHVVEIDDVCVNFAVDAFEKVILNLLSNALKYTNAGGEVWVSIVTRDDKKIELSVRDSGIGIAKDKQASVFERYHRVLDEQSEKITGAGIGLALVKELVEAHNGSIHLESEKDVGSTFTVVFDAVEHSGNSSPASVNYEMLEFELESIKGQSVVNQSELTRDEDDTLSADPHGDESQKPVVLVIEDNPDMREYIIDCLSEKFTCLQAANGKQGVAVAISEIPDLVISDIMMPEMNGYQVSQILKEDEKTSHIPVILLTARGDRESRLHGWKNHADEYLTKPFDSEELNIRVGNLLSIRNILRQRFAGIELENQSAQQLVNAGMNKKDQDFVGKIKDCCEKNYTDSEFEIAKLAEAVFMSERQLQRKLKALIDRSPGDYLRLFRLNKAKQKLQEGGQISQVAFDVGFSSQAYFSKCFKAQFGLTAKQYQKGE